MNIFRIPLFTILDLSATLFACLFVNWWAPLFAYDGESMDRGQITKGPRLPDWLAWFDTFDATLDAGLKPGEKSSYWTRMRWLYRNPAYGFSYWALGCEFDPRQWVVRQYEEKPLTFKAENYNTDDFNYVVVKFGIKFKLGWKAWNYFTVDPQGVIAWKRMPWGPEMRAPFVFSISLSKE